MTKKLEKRTIAEQLRQLRDDATDSKTIQRVKDALCAQPEATVECILGLELTKYDSEVVEVLERIGSPIADPCAQQLIELIYDLNWPVHPAALSAVFSLDGPAVVAGLQCVIAEGDFYDFSVFCYHALRENPSWLPMLRPCLTEAIGKAGDEAIDSWAEELLENLANG